MDRGELTVVHVAQPPRRPNLGLLSASHPDRLPDFGWQALLDARARPRAGIIRECCSRSALAIKTPNRTTVPPLYHPPSRANSTRSCPARRFCIRRNSAVFCFVVEQEIAGQGEQLKEYILGIQALRKDESFDPRIDTAVRTEARRLRQKLAEYYQAEGRNDPIEIALPKGSYRAVFHKRAVAASPTVTTPSVPRRAPRLWIASVIVLAMLAGRNQGPDIPLQILPQALASRGFTPVRLESCRPFQQCSTDGFRLGFMSQIGYLARQPFDVRILDSQAHVVIHILQAGLLWKFRSRPELSSRVGALTRKATAPAPPARAGKAEWRRGWLRRKRPPGRRRSASTESAG